MRRRKFLKISLFTLLVSALIFLGLRISSPNFLRLIPPEEKEDSIISLKRIKNGDSCYSIGKNWFKLNKYGLFELYVEGKPFERGVINGKLMRELVIYQEKVFVDQIMVMIPSERKLRLLRIFIAWFNRKIDHYIPHEFLEEIYGVSLSADSKYSFIGSNYERLVNYHAAHDIGHALADFHMVECTSFACWGKKSKDSTLIIARNFDFYAGDKFAENKIVTFIKPDKGYKMMLITWGGMIGAVSGMNEKGLTVTINAAKSHIPFAAKTPISILTREILQYAKNIDEAYAIAFRMTTFVSESILIGSLADNKSVIIEKSPKKTVLFKSDQNFIISTNHFQSEEFSNKSIKSKNVILKASDKRFQRVKQLLNKHNQIDVYTSAAILRDQKGLDDKDIGMGNEEAINQLICHHSIIFKPSELKVWVSTPPYQLGPYICYDLNEIFSLNGLKQNRDVTNPALMIPADSFLVLKKINNFLIYKKYRDEFKTNSIKNDTIIRAFILSNPEFYLAYMQTGDYYFKKEEFSKALYYYELASTKEVPTYKETDHIKKRIEKCKEELK